MGEALIRVFGDYHCRNCNLGWTSTSTYVSQDKKTLYSQECMACGDEIYADFVTDLCYECDDYPCRCYCDYCDNYGCQCCDICGNYPCRCEQRVYGFYKCKKCQKTWVSAYAFVETGTGKNLYTQQ